MIARQGRRQRLADRARDTALAAGEWPGPAAPKAVDAGESARGVDRVCANQVRPLGLDPRPCLLDERFAIQTHDSVDRDGIPVSPGAILRGPVQLAVELKDPPRGSGTGDVGLHRIEAVRRPRPERGLCVVQMELLVPVRLGWLGAVEE